MKAIRTRSLPQALFKGLVVSFWALTGLLLAKTNAQTLTTIKPVMSLTGQWSTTTAQHITIKMDKNGQSFALDMQPLDRPNAYGEFVATNIIEVRFPDAEILIGKIDPARRSIAWSNQTTWIQQQTSEQLVN